MTVNQPIIQVDAFTDCPFQGNPAAVCVLSAPQSEEWMQQVAREMNLSETAFLVPQEDGFNLRWFTPATEVGLCGHATLASAHVLWSDGHLSPNYDATFITRSGILAAHKAGEWIELDFPVSALQKVEAPLEVSHALQTSGKGTYLDPANQYLLMEVDSVEQIANLTPNFPMLKAASFHGIIVTSRSDDDAYDFVSRFFAPAMGIDEDPVTGSAHCCLAPFWRDRLGKDEMVAYQASHRGGVVRMAYEGGDRLIIAGQAVTVMRGELV